MLLIFFHDLGNFTGSRETPAFELGEDQRAVHFHFESAAIRRDQGQRIDRCLETAEQFLRQAYSLVGIMSDNAVLDGDLHR